MVGKKASSLEDEGVSQSQTLPLESVFGYVEGVSTDSEDMAAVLPGGVDL
jgi:hypothetical protein